MEFFKSSLEINHSLLETKRGQIGKKRDRQRNSRVCLEKTGYIKIFPKGVNTGIFIREGRAVLIQGDAVTERKTKERLRQIIQGWLQRKRNGKGDRQAGRPKGHQKIGKFRKEIRRKNCSVQKQSHCFPIFWAVSYDLCK